MTESILFISYYIHKCWHLSSSDKVEKLCYRKDTPLVVVVAGTRTWVLADSMTIAASALTTAPTRHFYFSPCSKGLNDNNYLMLDHGYC